ncbi:c-type cytochrome [Rhizobium alvei]|uniref:Cytochrome c n=1 Tax=Rhizobium alvei TaxID=1132659 RepID=A0ABT8YR19_9HYPH|nr:cytochrome c [Rhizobium alvei]MDO6966155.1 cytochrome c [Rhizobium alvei]
MRMTLFPSLLLSMLSASGAALAADAPAGVKRGKQVFAKWCAPCHGPGRHTPGTMALHFKYNDDPPPLLEMRGDLDIDMLAYTIRNGASIMPSFRKTEISDADIEALAMYLKASARK